MRQLVLESTLLAMLGGLAGLGLALLGVAGLRMIDPGGVPRIEELRVDGSIVVFTVALSVVTGFCAGLLPALKTSDATAALGHSLRGSASSQSSVAMRTRALLLASEVAVTLVLLVGAGLLIRSLWQVNRVDPGIDVDGVISASLTLPRQTAPGSDDPSVELERRATFFRGLLSELDVLPDVESASLISGLPFGGGATSWSIRVEGQPHTRGAAPQGFWRIASPEVFDTLGIRLLAGRGFTERDDFTRTGSVIINQSMAERLWPGEDPVGKRFFPWERETDPVEVVGVVADVRERHLERGVANIAYLPLYEYLQWSPMYLVVKANGDTSAALSQVREAASRLASDVPLANAALLRDVMHRTLAPRRFITILLSSFALLAIALAAIGIYGVLSFMVEKRSSEIGVRLALGATPRSVIVMVVRQTGAVLAIGGAIGIIAAIGLAKLVESLLFGVTALDAVSLIAAFAAICVVAFGASALPALRASRVDVVDVLSAD